MTSRSVILVSFVTIKIQLIKKPPQAVVSVTNIKPGETCRHINLKTCPLWLWRHQGDKETKGRKTSTTPSQIRTDCSLLNESLSHAPVTGCEHRYFKGDYRKPYSVLVRPYSLCPSTIKQARQGLSLDNMGQYKPDRCYLFTCGHFPQTRVSNHRY